jgi:hypothetical protein
VLRSELEGSWGGEKVEEETVIIEEVRQLNVKKKWFDNFWTVNLKWMVHIKGIASLQERCRRVGLGCNIILWENLGQQLDGS